MQRAWKKCPHNLFAIEFESVGRLGHRPKAHPTAFKALMPMQKAMQSRCLKLVLVGLGGLS